jgi:FolB domain-containing protein
MDRIYLRGLRLSCIIGVNDWEREVPQTVEIDLDLELDLSEAARRDDLKRSVDYKVIRDRVEAVVTESSCFLLEALAERIAQACLADHEVHSVKVRVEKPGALRAARTVGVEISRSRQGG